MEIGDEVSKLKAECIAVQCTCTVSSTSSPASMP
jgi:hypothetical protein